MPNAFHYANTFDDTLAAHFKGILSLGFDPRQLDGLRLWLDAAHTGSIIRDGNNLVSKWLDRSGYEAHMLQDIIGRRPIYAENAINNKPAIRTDGIDDSMIAAISPMGVVTVIFVAASLVNPIPASNVQAFLATAPSGATPQGWSITGKAWSFTTERRIRSEGNFAAQHYKNGVAGNPGHNPGVTTDLELGVPFIVVSKFSGGTINTQLHLGELQNGSNRGQHDFGEIIIFNRLLPAKEQQILEAYLSKKWAIPLQI